MPIHFVVGDLFANRFGADAFAHGCNCAGLMGAGIAVGFKLRYPEMLTEYKRLCKTALQFCLGGMFFWREEGKPAVFNLATQTAPRCRASLDAVEQALQQMRARAEEEKVTSIAVPRIGCGLGGLDWPAVRAAIETVFAGWSGDLYVYEEYKSEEDTTPEH